MLIAASTSSSRAFSAFVTSSGSVVFVRSGWKRRIAQSNFCLSSRGTACAWAWARATQLSHLASLQPNCCTRASASFALRSISESLDSSSKHRLLAAAAYALCRSLLWKTSLFVCRNWRFAYHNRTALSFESAGGFTGAEERAMMYGGISFPPFYTRGETLSLRPIGVQPSADRTGSLLGKVGNHGGQGW